MKHTILAVLGLAFVLPAATKADGFLFNGVMFTTITAPGSSVTAPLGLNTEGAIVGVAFIGTSPVSVGFLDQNGSFATITGPGGSVAVPTGINDSGQMVGFGAGNQSFLDTNGQFITLAAPGTQTGAGGQFTEASSINDHGEVSGTFATGRASNGTENSQGFLYANGKFTIVDAPGATRTDLFGVNDLGQAVGQAFTDTSTGTSVQDFIYFDGVFSDFNIPCSSIFGAQISGINDQDQMVGTCGSSAFIFNLGTDRLTLINVPGAVSTQGTGINDAGEIVGSFTTPEPGSLLLIGTGLLSMACILYRNRFS